MKLHLSHRKTNTGYKGVYRHAGKFSVKVWRAGLGSVEIGRFATAVEGARCYAEYVSKEGGGGEFADSPGGHSPGALPIAATVVVDRSAEVALQPLHQVQAHEVVPGQARERCTARPRPPHLPPRARRPPPECAGPAIPPPSADAHQLAGGRGRGGRLDGRA